jgi:3-dehydro-L-gulonate 2-dehydrogenase
MKLKDSQHRLSPIKRMERKSRVVPKLIRIPFEQMEKEFTRVLGGIGFESEAMSRCARLFAENTLDGVYTHGINRFPRFVQYVKDGYIRVNAKPELRHRAGAIEQWDGCLGPGPLNALFAVERAMDLSKECGMGCVALSNTNHWMRGGHYAWKAAKAGFVFIGWTNTTANMPAWGAVDCRLGNNPLVLGVPFKDEAIVLDMAMSQFSYGLLESHQVKSMPLPMPGGYNRDGALTTDASEILESRRLLPMGYWKGSGLALLLDVLAAVLSGGLSTSQISHEQVEFAVSQVFIAFDISQLSTNDTIQESVDGIVRDLHESVAAGETRTILYPGERVLHTRTENLKDGIPVDRSIWEEIQRL